MASKQPFCLRNQLQLRHQFVSTRFITVLIHVQCIVSSIVVSGGASRAVVDRMGRMEWARGVGRRSGRARGQDGWERHAQRHLRVLRGWQRRVFLADWLTGEPDAVRAD